MAMIGDGAAVAEVGAHHHELHGHVAFAAWLGVHAWLMSGVRQRVDAFVSWAWDFLGSSQLAPSIDPDAARDRLGRRGRRPTAERTGAANHGDQRDRSDRHDRALRRHHHRQRRRRWHAGPHPGRVGQADPAPRAGRLPAARDGQLGPRARCSSTASTSPPTPGTTPTASRSNPRSTTSSAAPPSSTAPRCTACGRRTSASCSHVDGISPAWPLSYDDFEPWYTQGRVALPGARQRRRGPDRGPPLAALPVAGGVPRAAHPAALRRAGRAATTRSTRRAASCSTRPTAAGAPASAARGATATPAWCTPRPTPRRSPSARSSTCPT